MIETGIIRRLIRAFKILREGIVQRMLLNSVDKLVEEIYMEEENE